ncbi:peptidyl-tRNA hydrolase [Paraphysoderma sedebokerense]|nr:peptidyl-tRNA hydrolase [Paraphysoderma sedebokerense]
MTLVRNPIIRPPTFIILALGNHGPQFKCTRHNAGQIVLDSIASSMRLAFVREREYDIVETKLHKFIEPCNAKITLFKELMKKGFKITKTKTALKTFSGPKSSGNSSDSSITNHESGIEKMETDKEAIKETISMLEANIYLIKVRCFMNESGKYAARTIKNLRLHYPTNQPKLLKANSRLALDSSALASETHLIVLHDDLDRPFGKLSLKYGGSASGHNGLKSLVASLRTDAFTRLRIGIDRPSSSSSTSSLSVANYVLSKFPSEEKDELLSTVSKDAHEILSNLILRETWKSNTAT